MTYHQVTIPAALAAVTKTGDASVTHYYKGTAAVVAGLAAKQDKVAGVEMQQHTAVSAFGASDETNQKSLEQWFSVANDPIRFIPLGSSVWAGIEPGDQIVHSPIQIQFAANGAVNVRVAARWRKQFEGKKLRVACET